MTRVSGVGAGGAAFGGGGQIDAAVHLKAEGQVARLAPLVDLPQLGQHVAAEGLAAEAGLDGHDQNQVDFAQQVLDGGSGCARVQDDPALAAQGADAGQCLGR